MTKKQEVYQGRIGEDRIAGVYIRIGCEIDAQEQWEDCKQLLERLQLSHVIHYTDVGELTKDENSQYSKMMKDAEKGNIDIIISSTVQVLTTDALDLFNLCKDINKKNVHVHCCKDGVDTSTAIGTLSFHFFTGVFPLLVQVPGMIDWLSKEKFTLQDIYRTEKETPKG